MKWFKDPKTKEDSVSLSLLVASFGLLCVFGGLEAFDITKSSGPFLELVYGTSALYFGRRFSFKGQQFSDEGPAKQLEESLNK